MGETRFTQSAVASLMLVCSVYERSYPTVFHQAFAAGGSGSCANLRAATLWQNSWSGRI